MNSTRFVIHTHLPAPSSVFRVVSTGEAVCPHASHWARAAGWNLFSSSFKFRIFCTKQNVIADSCTTATTSEATTDAAIGCCFRWQGRLVQDLQWHHWLCWQICTRQAATPLGASSRWEIIYMWYQFTVTVTVTYQCSIFLQDQRRFSSGHPLWNG